MSFQLLNLSKIVSQLLYANKVVILNSVTSTNQYLIDNMLCLKSGSVCVAECQTQGRGRYGKFWISPRSNNVYLSMYWSGLKRNNGESIIVLSLVISVAIEKVLKKFGVQGIMLKWPNDIYYEGRKLGGVLIEVITTKSCNYFHIVIGIGINVTKHFRSLKDAVKSISLEEIGLYVDRNILVSRMINMLYQSLLDFEFFGFIPFFSRWLSLDVSFNQVVRLLFGNRIISGISRGIDYNGSLLLEYSGSIYSCSCVENISLRY